MSPLTTTAPATLEDTLYTQLTAAFAQEPRHAAITSFRALAAKHEMTPEGEQAFVNAGCRVLFDKVNESSLKVVDLFRTLADTATGDPALSGTVRATGLCMANPFVSSMAASDSDDTYMARLANEYRQRRHAAATAPKPATA